MSVHPSRRGPFRHPGSLAAAVACTGSLVLAGCSHPAAVHVTGLAGLGASSHNWSAVHGPANSPSGSSFGPVVDTGAGTWATYTGVTFSGGHVAGWVMAFPAGTRLVAAERLVSHDLPSDTQQTASARQDRQSGTGVCEVVSYQSLQLRLTLAGGTALADGRFTVSFFEVEPSGSVSASYARVNRAVVGEPSSVPSPTCP